MAYRIGIVGPEDLVSQTMQLMEDYPQLIPLPLAYMSEKTCLDYVEQGLDNEAHAFLFTGFLPYTMAKAHGLTRPSFYFPIADSSLVRLLFNLRTHHGVDVEHLSIDTIPLDEIRQVYQDLALSPEFVRVNPGTLENFDAEEYVQFHRQCYETGQTEAGITAINSVYERLTGMGTTIFRAVPTQSTMRRTLNLVATFVDGEIARDSQLILQIFHTGTQRLKGHSFSRLCSWLDDYARLHHGAVFVTAMQEIIVLINWGIFRKHTNLYATIPRLGAIEEEIGTPLFLGMGMGHTAKEAEDNARDAIQLAREKPHSNAFIINSEKEVVGPLALGEKRPRTYRLRSYRSNLQLIAEKTDLSISTLSKVEDLMDTINQSCITAKNIQDGLEVSLRTANRILKRLVEAGFAIEVGSEDSVGRGRPRRIYQLRLTAAPLSEKNQ